MMIYAVSDIHGDYDRFVALLKEKTIVDDDLNWNIGNSVFVVNGDSTDRGNKSIEVLELLYKLKDQAAEVGGTLIHTMGNHDAMLLTMVQEHIDKEVDYEHAYIFQCNGGKTADIHSMINNPHLYEWMRTFPAMCKVDDILFQHCDGCKYYLDCASKYKDYFDESAEGRIKSINAYFAEQSLTSWGAWNIFYELTESRYFDGMGDKIGDYLSLFDASTVVHGHTPVTTPTPVNERPKVYLNGHAINIDFIMSSGYHNNPDRGFILELESYTHKIVV